MALHVQDGDPQKVLRVTTRPLETYTGFGTTGGRRVLRRNESGGASPRISASRTIFIFWRPPEIACRKAARRTSISSTNAASKAGALGLETSYRVENEESALPE